MKHALDTTATALLRPGRQLALTASVALAALCGPPLPATTVLKCVDAEGKLLFTDATCPPGTRSWKEVDAEIQRPGRAEPAPEASHPRPATALPPSPPPKPETHPRAPRTDPPANVPMIAKATMGARFTRALADLSTLKTYSLMHMAERGQWPTRAEDMGLDSGSFHTDDIVEVGLRQDGGIVAYLVPTFGHERWIWLQPRAALGGANVTWACRTNLEKQSLIPGAYGTCEWTAGPARQKP